MKKESKSLDKFSGMQDLSVHKSNTTVCFKTEQDRTKKNYLILA